MLGINSFKSDKPPIPCDLVEPSPLADTQIWHEKPSISRQAPTRRRRWRTREWYLPYTPQI